MINKRVELRALPPKVEEMNKYIERMNTIVDKADRETRAVNEAEQKEFIDLKAKVDKLKEEIRLEEETRALDMKPVKVNYDDLKIIQPNQSFASECRNHTNIKMGDIVKAMSGKDATHEATEYVRSMNSVTGAVTIPQQLAGTIFDIARSQSAVLGRIPAVNMDANNLTIAKISKDATASFVAEGELIPESSALFEGVTLKGKTMAIYVPVTEQLLSSANISDVLMSACGKAIAEALDKAFIYGDGKGANIKGLATYDGINKVDHDGPADYNMLLKGVKASKKANIRPTDVVVNTNTGTDLAMLTDANGQYIVPPRALDTYTLSESNNIEDNQALVYDAQSLLVGINDGISIEWGYSNDGFQRMVKSLRIYIRCDLGVINEKAVSLVTATV